MLSHELTGVEIVAILDEMDEMDVYWIDLDL